MKLSPEVNLLAWRTNSRPIEFQRKANQVVRRASRKTPHIQNLASAAS